MTFSVFAIFLRLVYMFLRVEDKNSFPPPLSSEEERECFEKLLGEGDAGIREKAREKLILHNLRLVAHIVKKYSGQEKNQEDLLSIGTIGLIKAIDTFKPENGTKFATYAGKCLQNEILMYFRSQKKLQGEVSINETIDIDKDGNPLTYGDIICVEDNVADSLHLRVAGANLHKLIKTKLTDREREIITKRYGLDGDEPRTQREIADRMGISRSYVSRIEKSALEKLRSSHMNS